MLLRNTAPNNDMGSLKVKGGIKIDEEKCHPMGASAALLIQNKTDLKIKCINRHRDDHNIVMKYLIHQKDIIQ